MDTSDPPVQTKDEAKLRAVIEECIAALRAKTAEGVTRHHAQDYVLFSLAPPLIAEGDAAKGLNDWFATWRGQLGYEITELKLQVSERLALAHGLAHLTGTKTDGEKADVWFRITLGFRKINGAWKVVHEHESVPFYMDGSFKAAVDLKP